MKGYVRRNPLNPFPESVDSAFPPSLSCLPASRVRPILCAARVCASAKQSPALKRRAETEKPAEAGCGHGKTRQQALVSAEQAIEAWLEVTREFGERAPKPGGRLLTVAQAAKHLGVSVAMARRYCANGQLAAAKVGRYWTIHQRDLDVLIGSERQRRTLRHTQAQPA